MELKAPLSSTPARADPAASTLATLRDSAKKASELVVLTRRSEVVEKLETELKIFSSAFSTFVLIRIGELADLDAVIKSDEVREFVRFDKSFLERYAADVDSFLKCLLSLFDPKETPTKPYVQALSALVLRLMDRVRSFHHVSLEIVSTRAGLLGELEHQYERRSVLFRLPEGVLSLCKVAELSVIELVKKDGELIIGESSGERGGSAASLTALSSSAGERRGSSDPVIILLDTVNTSFAALYDEEVRRIDAYNQAVKTQFSQSPALCQSLRFDCSTLLEYASDVKCVLNVLGMFRTPSLQKRRLEDDAILRLIAMLTSRFEKFSSIITETSRSLQSLLTYVVGLKSATDQALLAAKDACLAGLQHIISDLQTSSPIEELLRKCDELTNEFKK